MIKITFPDNSVKEYAEGTTAMQIAESISSRLAQEVLAASVNGEIWDLTRPINQDAAIKLFKWEDEEGKHAFWHSSAHLMAEALQELYPGIKFGIGPAIENGFYYDVDPGEATIKEGDFPAIEAKMLELVAKKEEIKRQDISKADALKMFGDRGEEYKTELISELEDGKITTYTQGAFTDLCRGPHLPNTSYLKAVKIMSVAGAYWRGDEKRKQLVRLYGITFPKKKMLDEYLALMEEAKKRDHRKIGKELELFTFSTAVGAGLPLWLPRGTQLRLKLEDFLKRIQKKYGYQQVMTPHIGGKQLYVTSGHYAKYGKDSFQPIHTPQEGEEFLLKPMNCPHHCEIFKSFPRSYKDLPLRFAEFGTVYRYEQSGELHGLTRVRGFTQDDAHLFCRPDQLKDEFLKVMDIIFIIFKALDFENFEAQISLRDKVNRDKYIGSEENWEKAESAIIEACQEKGLKAKIEYGEAAFYGPKLDFMVKDAIGRRWQLGTIQVDYNLPERFELEYTGEDNKKHRPVMIHRAPFGSMERFVAVLIEHTGGKFPLWLTPDQVAILPISEKFNDYAYEVKRQLEAEDLSVLVDDRNEKIGRKIRDTELKRIPYMLIVGEKEAENNEVSVRKQGEGDKGSMKITTFAALLKGEVEDQMNHWKKDWEIYLMKGCSDEMQMSLSDFEFAVKLPRKKNKLEYESDLEQVVKTALLWIEEDLSFRHGGSPVEINSQTLFSDGYVQEKTGDAAFRKKYKQYMVPVKGVEGVYKVAFESLWENCFSEMGYREFKRDLYNGNLFEGVRAAAVGKHDVLLKESAADICSKLASLLKSLKDLLTVSLYGNKGKFEEDDLRSIFAAYDMDVPSAKRFITSLLESRVEEGRSVSYITSAKKKDEDKLMFTVTRGFDLLLSRYQKLCAQRITGKKGDRLLFYVTPFSDLNMLLKRACPINAKPIGKDC